MPCPNGTDFDAAIGIERYNYGLCHQLYELPMADLVTSRSPLASNVTTRALRSVRTTARSPSPVRSATKGAIRLRIALSTESKQNLDFL